MKFKYKYDLFVLILLMVGLSMCVSDTKDEPIGEVKLDGYNSCISCSDMMQALKYPDQVSSVFIYYSDKCVDTLLKFKNLNAVYFYYLPDNKSFKNVLASLSKIKTLKKLDFDRSCNFDEIPNEIGLLGGLEELNFADTIKRISDQFYFLTGLRRLNLLSSDISDSLSNLKNLEEVTIANPYSGELPLVISQLVNLKRIYLYPSIDQFTLNLRHLTKLVMFNATGALLIANASKMTHQERQLLFSNIEKNLPDSCKLVMY